jgi:hypothetical protein
VHYSEVIRGNLWINHRELKGLKSVAECRFRAIQCRHKLFVYLNGSAPTTAGSCKYSIVSCRLLCSSRQKFCTEVSWRQTFSPSTQTRTLIPVLSVVDARHGGVKVGSNS